MKKILYSLLIGLAILFASCEDETTQDHSSLTYYVALELKGDAFMKVPVNTAYNEPGVIATENGEDVASKVVFDGSVDPTKMGLYHLTYSAVNKDGFPSSISRTVAVYDPSVTVSIPSGTYKLAAGSNRYNKTSGAVTAYSGYSIKINEEAPGIYSVSDFLGGYYDQRAGYGSNYAMKGYMKINNDYTFDILSGDVAGWGDSYETFENATYDTTTGTLSWAVAYASNYVWTVILTKQ